MATVVEQQRVARPARLDVRDVARVQPLEGAPIRWNGEVVGNVTGSWDSPLFGRALMLGWLRRTPFPDRVEIDGREAVVTPTPFYDPEGHRARA